MNGITSCKFNIDTGNVECRFTDGTVLSVDCDAVEDALEIATFSKVQTELDWLVYNAPRDYVRLLLNGELEGYLKRVSGSEQWLE
ncbi:hypothetical protein GPL26_22840 [Enterocloster citroniae]|uniref:Uncharacterized protein n=1 Tax=Enterocloster citroniae TaxID=358743 RepID=A0AA41K702_9FIRM|nr:DUF6061 family protein [Enterocloster citroniae]MBT9812441.1 hypothetical protein [Enterocloster citroniae]